MGRMTSKYQSRCLVIGGKGFIGSHLVDALLRNDFAVRVFDRPNVISLYQTQNHPMLEVVEGDFTCHADIAEAFVGCDICFHLASTTLPKSSNLDPLFDIETNLVGTVKLLQAAVEANIKRFVFLSSGGTVYGPPSEIPIRETHLTHPLCSYGITKVAIENYLSLFRDLYGLNYMVLRLANPFGERQRIHASQGAIAVFLAKALCNEAIQIWGDGSVIRDYIYISDVISSLLLAVSYNGQETVFNIGSGIGISLNQALDSIENVINRPVKRVYEEGRTFDTPINVLAIDRAIHELNWRPETPFMEGLQRMANWIEHHIL